MRPHIQRSGIASILMLILASGLSACSTNGSNGVTPPVAAIGMPQRLVAVLYLGSIPKASPTPPPILKVSLSSGPRLTPRPTSTPSLAFHPPAGPGIKLTPRPTPIPSSALKPPPQAGPKLTPRAISTPSPTQSATPMPTQSPTPTPAPTPIYRQYYVSAYDNSIDHGWLDTGLILPVGATFSVTASGTACIQNITGCAPGGSGGPDGIHFPDTCGGMTCGALYGRIGSGTMFVVGSSLPHYPVTAMTGNNDLEFGYGDTAFGDNSGGFTVTVIVILP